MNDRDLERMLASPTARRRLRASDALTPELAARLLDFAEDVRSQRPDPTLGQVVARAPSEALNRHLPAIAAGAGAAALWERLAESPDRLVDAALRIIESNDAEAIEATVTYVLLDPVDAYDLGKERRSEIAAAALETDHDGARGIAAEFLASAAPRVLAERLDGLAYDAVPRVRGYAWLAAFRVDRDRAFDRALEILGDESLPVEARKSALTITGEVMPTDDVAGLLTYFVVHPTAELALEAAGLLFRHHRHPQIALAAAQSDHEQVRDIAAQLLDPYRGSPAAGGSRPGDPLRGEGVGGES